MIVDQKLAKTLLPAVLFASECTMSSRSTTSSPASRRTSPSSIIGMIWFPAADIGALEQGMAGVGREDLACLIYTSGTGGAPA